MVESFVINFAAIFFFFFLTLIRYFSFWELNDIEIENEVIIKLLIFVLYIL